MNSEDRGSASRGSNDFEPRETANDLPWGAVRSRKFWGDAVLHVGGWYHCQCYPCPRLTKWSSIVWNSSVCPSCTVAKQRAAIAKAEGRS